MAHIISVDLDMEITLPDGTRYVKLLTPSKPVSVTEPAPPVKTKTARKRHTGPPREFEHKQWSHQETLDLINEKLAGKSNRTIAKDHKRTPKAIAVRVALLRKQGLLPPSTRTVRVEASHIVVTPQPSIEVK